MAPNTNFAWALALLSLFSATVSAQIPYYEAVREGHGILGCLTFAIVFPAGAILMRAGNFKSLVWVHAGVQLLGYAMLCYVFGTGVWFSYVNEYYVDPHIEIGIILFGLCTFQPFIGTIHHWMFKRYSHRTFVSVVHILLGRSIVLIGLINGGLGLLVADNATVGQMQAYGIIVGILYFVYIFTISYLEARNAKEQKWMVETDGALAKKEMGVEAKKLGVYEDVESQ